MTAARDGITAGIKKYSWHIASMLFLCVTAYLAFYVWLRDFNTTNIQYGHYDGKTYACHRVIIRLHTAEEQKQCYEIYTKEEFYSHYNVSTGLGYTVVCEDKTSGRRLYRLFAPLEYLEFKWAAMTEAH